MLLNGQKVTAVLHWKAKPRSFDLIKTIESYNTKYRVILSPFYLPESTAFSNQKFLSQEEFLGVETLPRMKITGNKKVSNRASAVASTKYFYFATVKCFPNHTRVTFYDTAHIKHPLCDAITDD